MSCEQVRPRIEAGEAIDGEMTQHLQACKACGTEFSFLLALKAARPVPPASLRERILRPTASRRRRWAVAAAVLAAASIGFVVGAVAFPPRVEVRTVRLEADTRRQLSVLGYALRGLYGRAVDVRFEGNQVTSINADKDLEKRHPTCPVLKEARKFSDLHPDLISWR